MSEKPHTDQFEKSASHTARVVKATPVSPKAVAVQGNDSLDVSVVEDSEAKHRSRSNVSQRTRLEVLRLIFADGNELHADYGFLNRVWLKKSEGVLELYFTDFLIRLYGERLNLLVHGISHRQKGEIMEHPKDPIPLKQNEKKAVVEKIDIEERR